MRLEDWDNLPWTSRGLKFKWVVEALVVWSVTLILMIIGGFE